LAESYCEDISHKKELFREFDIGHTDWLSATARTFSHKKELFGEFDIDHTDWLSATARTFPIRRSFSGI
jgi:hypothetical protein